ncbi:hypothetical protein [Pleomorphomonas sp. PLEO]|uniref:hypothetical protein n=1 Tax=Pleomorphomonas sp. PLEO TaxID=3239306 RepID=UPI00351DEB46
MSNDFRLSISDEAKNKIDNLIAEHKIRYNKEGIPALVWIDSEFNNGMVESQPAIGFYLNRDDIVPADFLILGGIEIALTVPDEYISRFQDKTLDYENDRFVLR